MITLSDSAVEKINSLAANVDDPKKCLRIFVEPGGCSGFEYGMTFNLPKDDDHKMNHNGVSFVVAPDSFSYLDGCNVDFDDGLHGKGFEINNPNAENTCGCGRSFS